MKIPNRSAFRRYRPGFALIITISLMVLLALLAVGLLGLSSVSLRSSNRTEAIAEARANARLALTIALGELQKHAGPDQRITAPGDIADAKARHGRWTGVWDSWKAGDGEPSGNDEPSDHATIPGRLNEGMHPSYEDGRRDHFRGWLVSTDPELRRSLESSSNAPLDGTPAPEGTETSIKLVGEGTLGSAATTDHVVAGVQNITASGRREGRMAWWVGDESLKARLLDDSYEVTPPDSTATRLARHQAPGNAGIQVVDAFSELDPSGALSLASTRETLGLLDEVDGTLARQSFHDLTPHSIGLLCDVREGGLKRDLSGLLSRPIDQRETDDSFMLYRFGRNDDRVPIQDLAAYYQLYRDEVAFSSRELRRGMQIKNLDFNRGGEEFLRGYTNLYRLPVPIKVQFLLSMIAEPRTSQEKRNNPGNRDTHKLNIGISPAITLWNPYNVPLAMNLGASTATQFRFFNLPMAIRWTKEGDGYTSSTPTSLAWLSNGAATGDRDTGFTVFFSGSRPVVFEPGQVRVFSLANHSLDELRNSDTYKNELEVQPGWNPETFIQLKRSDRSQNAQHIEPPNGGNDGALTFSSGDRISFRIEPIETVDLANGSALQFFNRQSSAGGAKNWMARHFQLISRMSGAKSDFNRRVMELGMPDGSSSIEYEAKAGREILSGPVPFLLVNLAAGCETAEDDNFGAYAGRRFPSRPFLHSSPVTGRVMIDRDDRDGLYQHGWNWWVEDVNSAFEANVSIDRSNNGYFGGGYTAESGATHIVQQEVPVAPPISIAALSHAQLGGYSLADAYLGPGASQTSNNFQETTASGQGGLLPHTVQAIGNSYAHPHLAPDAAFGTWLAYYTEDTRRPTREHFADHSYLANKALWDEYFFSSVTDSRSQAFGRDRRGTAQQVASEFFFGEGSLLNSRFLPHVADLSESTLSSYFDRGEANFDGIDRLSSHLLVEGPFNVNSTSVDAWRAVFSSLRGKPVAFLEAESALSGSEPDTGVAEGAPVSSFTLPNGAPWTGSTDDPSEPDQWTGWRELGDDEIDALAEAMVDEVRKRGPFLSLSEFVNRRLDASNKDLAVKGALQAALDNPDVPINAGHRSDRRTLGDQETADMSPEFPEALEGPVAYGSAAYVDQADLLRGLSAQLTPRGDTFVIRTYGDSLDASGDVEARAWCEAVVQRFPEYADPSDAPHLKQSELTSDVNERFGRSFRIVSFRYLQASEI